VIIPDINLLIYATDELSVHHRAASTWWSTTVNGHESVGLPWVTTLAFLRLTTNPRVVTSPLTPEQATSVVRDWLARPQVSAVEPTGRHVDLVADLLADMGTAGNLVVDAHLAALAIEHGAALYSADADFSRFTGLRWVNPLRAG
jgi:hypothetical protein